MSNKYKKYGIMLAELPLIALFLVIKVIVAIITVIYIRGVRKGIFYGNRLHNYLETHEMGNNYKKKN